MPQIANSQVHRSLTIFLVYSISTVLFVASRTSIIVAFFIPESMRAYYIVYHQSAIYISP